MNLKLKLCTCTSQWVCIYRYATYSCAVQTEVVSTLKVAGIFAADVPGAGRHRRKKCYLYLPSACPMTGLGSVGEEWASFLKLILLRILNS